MSDTSTQNNTINYIDRYYQFKETPHCMSKAFPIIALSLLVLLLFIPVLFICKCDCDWLFYSYLILSGVLLVLAASLIVKRLVPYWTKVADINDKMKEKLIRMEEEQLESAQLAERSKLGMEERKARAELEETAKKADNSRKLEIMKQELEVMKQEHQSHLADVALEMVKAGAQSKESDKVEATIKEIVQIIMEKLSKNN